MAERGTDDGFWWYVLGLALILLLSAAYELVGMNYMLDLFDKLKPINEALK